MRNKDKKNRKGQETTIGKIIYGFLLFMPLLAIVFTCLYAVFNKNAYKSYYGETINDSTQVNNNLSTINNSEYLYLNTQNYENLNTNFELYTHNFELVDNGNLQQSTVNTFNSTTDIRIYCRANNTPEFYKINEDNSYTWITNSTFFVCKFIINNTSGTINNPSGFYTIEYNKDSFVSEVFYYSVDRVTENPLFNWAQNSVIYTTTNATCNALSINTPFIPLLMSYWLIISIIYFLYDIALMLVWLIHRKIHELQESL